MCSESAEIPHLCLCCGTRMDLLFCTGQEPPAPSPEQSWAAPISPQTPGAPGAAPLPRCTELLPPGCGLGMRNCDTASSAQSRWRLRPKEELGHIPGHCPGLGLPLDCPAAALPLPCCPTGAAIRRLGGLGETGSRGRICSGAPSLRPSRVSSTLRSPCPVCPLWQCHAPRSLSVPCTEISAPVLPEGLAETSCRFSCKTVGAKECQPPTLRDSLQEG